MISLCTHKDTWKFCLSPPPSFVRIRWLKNRTVNCSTMRLADIFHESKLPTTCNSRIITLRSWLIVFSRNISKQVPPSFLDPPYIIGKKSTDSLRWIIFSPPYPEWRLSRRGLECPPLPCSYKWPNQQCHFSSHPSSLCRRLQCLSCWLIVFSRNISKQAPPSFLAPPYIIGKKSTDSLGWTRTNKTILLPHFSMVG